MPANRNYSILFVTHYTDLYGANRSMLNLIAGLKQTGIKDISVIIPHEGQICNKLTQLSIPYYVIPFVLEVHTKSQLYLKQFFKKIYNLLLIRKHNYRFKRKKNLIVHTNTSVTFFGAYLAQHLKAPHVWHIREFGKEDYNLEYNFGKDYFFKWINKAAAVICISKTLCDYHFKKKIKPVLRVIYNGVTSVESLDMYFISNSKNTPFRFGISGHISKEKNQAEAIEAFNLMHKNYDCELLIAGTGKDAVMQQLQQTIRNYGLEHRIKFEGFIDEISTFYESLDCMLMCSKNEALGRVTVEAMSKGLPVIGFNNAGTVEIIKDGYNGLLYSDGYVELADKMQKIIAAYETYLPMRKHALQTVKERFTNEAYTEAVMQVYDSIAEIYFSYNLFK